MEVAMFQQASRLKLRFDYKGICTVEDLWDIPLRSLDTIYKDLNAQMKEQQEDSLLETKSQEGSILDLKISIVKHIVKVRLDEQEARKNEHERSERKEKILSIIAEKKDQALYDMPVEELNKLVEGL